MLDRTGYLTGRNTVLLPLIRYVIFMAGIIFSFLTLVSLLGDFHWLLDLPSHFQIQYFWGLVTCLIALFFLTRRRLLWFLLLPALIVNGIILTPFTIPSAAADSPTGETPISILVINAYFRNPTLDAIVAEIERTRPDLVFISEAQPALMDRLAPLTRDRFPHVHDSSRTGTFGLALLSRFPLTVETVETHGGERVAMLDARVEGPEGRFALIGIHPLSPTRPGYPHMRNLEIDSLQDLAAAIELPLVIAGDFNAAPWSAPVRDLIAASDLKPAFRGFGLEHTWQFGPLLALVDFALVSPEWKILSYEIGGEIGSDHYPLWIELALRR